MVHILKIIWIQLRLFSLNYKYSGHMINMYCVFWGEKLIPLYVHYCILYRITAYFRLRVTCLFND